MVWYSFQDSNSLLLMYLFQIIQVEQELLRTQQAAGLPPCLPYDPTSFKSLTPQMTRKLAPATPLRLDAELSDTDRSDTSPDAERTATVERKMVKEELDRAVPQTDLLDTSASKAKGELGSFLCTFCFVDLRLISHVRRTQNFKYCLSPKGLTFQSNPTTRNLSDEKNPDQNRCV